MRNLRNKVLQIRTRGKTKKKHRHKWETTGDSCWSCGAYEGYCRKCGAIGCFDSKGKLQEIAK